jgi:hypothetical protein
VRSNNFCIPWGLQLPISFHQRFALLQFTGSSGPNFRYRCDSHSFAHGNDVIWGTVAPSYWTMLYDAICLVETCIGLEVQSSAFSILHDQFTVHFRAIIDLEAVDSEDDCWRKMPSDWLQALAYMCAFFHADSAILQLIWEKIETNDSPCWSIISPQAAISPIYKLATNPSNANTTTL